MARPGWPERNRAARSFRQLRRFHHVINSDKVFGTHREAEALRCVELWHNASIEVPEFERVSRECTFVPGLGLPGRVWSSLEPEYIPDVVSDDNFPRGPIAQREGLHAAFGLPILLGGGLGRDRIFQSRDQA